MKRLVAGLLAMVAVMFVGQAAHATGCVAVALPQSVIVQPQAFGFQPQAFGFQQRAIVSPLIVRQPLVFAQANGLAFSPFAVRQRAVIVSQQRFRQLGFRQLGFRQQRFRQLGFRRRVIRSPAVLRRSLFGAVFGRRAIVVR